VDRHTLLASIYPLRLQGITVYNAGPMAPAAGNFIRRLDRSEAIQNAMALDCYEPVQTQWATAILTPGARFVDVGASFGHYTALASQIVGPGGEVFAFEPSPLPHDTIAALIADNQIGNIRLVRSAVGDKTGEIDIFLPPKTDPVHSPSAFPSGDEFSACRVPVVALDDFAPLNDGRPIDLIKIDVEGSEPNVIAGMRRLIERGLVRNVMCEFNSGWLRQNGGMTPAALLETILGLGFSIRDRTEKTIGTERDGIHQFELQDMLFSRAP
jgi:FkbM family methyltransferase